jgi:hypothetical protein
MYLYAYPVGPRATPFASVTPHFSSAWELIGTKIGSAMSRKLPGRYIYTPSATSATVPTGIYSTRHTYTDRRHMKGKTVCIESWFRKAPCGYRCGGGRGHIGMSDVSKREPAWAQTFWWCASPQSRCSLF